jgi:uncharacterized damage-inducible protein DinB
MRKADIGTLVDYMYWVNHRLLEAAAGLTAEKFREPTTVATRDLRATLVHELDVEWSWRLNLLQTPIEEIGSEQELRPEDYPDVPTLRDHWARDEIEMRAWIDGLSDEDLEQEVASAFTRDRRPLWQYLLHIVTHAAQQQADAATLLSLAGSSPGEIDFLQYVESRSQRTEASPTG